MAKGNTGNLLQHFVGLLCAARLVEMAEGQPIEYIDCYSMAPWEPVDGGNPQRFVPMVKQFKKMKDQGDFVASTFLAAWSERYGGASIPDHPLHREYPNTAVLLRTAFPAQVWNMRLHEADQKKRGDLEKWSQQQPVGSYRVEGNWTQSSLIQNAAIRHDAAAMVMLDPIRIVDEADDDGYLPRRWLRYLFGRLALNVHEREQGAAPCIIAMFSYSDPKPEKPDTLVRAIFPKDKWTIDRVQSGPWNVNGRSSFHQGWAVTMAESSPPLVLPTLQEAWEKWACCDEDAEN